MELRLKERFSKAKKFISDNREVLLNWVVTIGIYAGTFAIGYYGTKLLMRGSTSGESLYSVTLLNTEKNAYETYTVTGSQLRQIEEAMEQKAAETEQQ